MSTSVRRALRRAALDAWLTRADEVLASMAPVVARPGPDHPRPESHAAPDAGGRELGPPSNP